MTLQTEAHWQNQQDIIERFADLLAFDFTLADTQLALYSSEVERDKADVHILTYEAMQKLYEQHVRDHDEAYKDDYITRQHMTV